MDNKWRISNAEKETYLSPGLVGVETGIGKINSFLKEVQGLPSCFFQAQLKILQGYIKRLPSGKATLIFTYRLQFCWISSLYRHFFICACNSWQKLRHSALHPWPRIRCHLNNRPLLRRDTILQSSHALTYPLFGEP